MKGEIVNEFNDVFTGVGRMKGVEIKLHVDRNVEPVVQPFGRILLPLREKVEQELRLEDAGIIEKVHEPTEWVSPIVIQPKKGSDEIRICTDMREAYMSFLFNNCHEYIYNTITQGTLRSIRTQ